MKIIYCPKYHCELNAIEGLWCHQKAYVRSRSDQTFDKMIKLISESRINFAERKI
jgi:transposase